MASGAGRRSSWRSRPAFAGRERGSDGGDWAAADGRGEGFLQRHVAVRVVVVVLLLGVVALAAFAAGSVLGYLNNTLGSLQSHDRPTVEAAKKHLAAAPSGAPMTILFLGSDRRQPRGPGHVDSILLVRLDPATRRMSLLLIPRDLLAPVPGHGVQPIAAAYRLGGPVLALETVEQLTDISINHFLDVDFQGFIDIVDTLGGVHVDVPSGLGVPPGPSWARATLRPGYGLLDGRQLLSYVRLEEDVYGGEGWLASQGAILTQLRSRLVAQTDWSDPLRALRLLKQATGNSVSDIAGVHSWYDLARLVVASEHGRITQIRLTGRTVGTGDAKTVTVAPARIRQAVRTFVAASSAA